MKAPEALSDLIKSGRNAELRSAVIDAPEQAKQQINGVSLILLAAYCRNTEAVEILKGYVGPLDFFEAAATGDEERVKVILREDPVIINSFSADGFTALGLASFFNQPHIVRHLLSAGADPNIASSNAFQVAPLHSACAISNLEIAHELIRSGANVNAAQASGVTPLHSAAHNGQTELSKLLIRNGAKVNAKMDNGNTPLFMALEKNFQETADLIRSNGGV